MQDDDAPGAGGRLGAAHTIKIPNSLTPEPEPAQQDRLSESMSASLRVVRARRLAVAEGAVAGPWSAAASARLDVALAAVEAAR